METERSASDQAPWNALKEWCWQRPLAALRRRFTRGDRYELVGDLLARRCGAWTCESVFARDVESWWTEPQAGGQVVHINLRNGQSLHWRDERMKLASLLRRAVPQAPDVHSAADSRAVAVPELNAAAHEAAVSLPAGRALG